MTIDLYYMPMSAPCRAVLLTIKAVGVDANLKVLDVLAGDQMKPDFVGINPRHCIPTIVDGDFSLWESRAICCYLAAQYGKDASLYPTEPKKKAVVDRLLYFDMGTLHNRFGEYAFPVLFAGQSPSAEKLTKLQEALGWLNRGLEGQQYVAGDHITVADHAIVASVSSFHEAGIDISSYSNIVDWFARCRDNMAGYKEANEAGAKMFGEFAKGKLGA